MAEEAIKKRVARAKQKAIGHLRAMGYQTIPSDNTPICIVGTCSTDVRIIRVVLDEITPEDQKILREYPVPGNCARELWLKRSPGTDFEVHRI